jgi:hypothetical protein
MGHPLNRDTEANITWNEEHLGRCAYNDALEQHSTHDREQGSAGGGERHLLGRFPQVGNKAWASSWKELEILYNCGLPLGQVTRQLSGCASWCWVFLVTCFAWSFFFQYWLKWARLYLASDISLESLCLQVPLQQPLDNPRQHRALLRPAPRPCLCWVVFADPTVNHSLMFLL